MALTLAKLEPLNSIIHGGMEQTFITELWIVEDWLLIHYCASFNLAFIKVTFTKAMYIF